MLLCGLALRNFSRRSIEFRSRLNWTATFGRSTILATRSVVRVTLSKDKIASAPSPSTLRRAQRARSGRHLYLSIFGRLLPRDGEFDQKGYLEWAAGVVALTATADPVRESGGYKVGFWQGVSTLTENIVHHLPLTHATDT